jgi:hypothetical protein
MDIDHAELPDYRKIFPNHDPRDKQQRILIMDCPKKLSGNLSLKAV